MKLNHEVHEEQKNKYLRIDAMIIFVPFAVNSVFKNFHN